MISLLAALSLSLLSVVYSSVYSSPAILARFIVNIDSQFTHIKRNHNRVNMGFSKALLAGRIRLKQCQQFSTAVSREENVLESTYKVRSAELDCEL